MLVDIELEDFELEDFVDGRVKTGKRVRPHESVAGHLVNKAGHLIC